MCFSNRLDNDGESQTTGIAQLLFVQALRPTLNRGTKPGGRQAFEVQSLDGGFSFGASVSDGTHDRLWGIEGCGIVVLMCPIDMLGAGVCEGQLLTLITDTSDGIHLWSSAWPSRRIICRMVAFPAIFAEFNPLVQLNHREKPSKISAAKGIPVWIVS